MDVLSDDSRRNVEELLHAAREKAQQGALQEQILAALLQTMTEQGAVLRTLEALVLEVRAELQVLERRRTVLSQHEAEPASSSERVVLLQGRRQTDRCSFCGISAAEGRTVFSGNRGASICTACIDVFNAYRT